MDVTRLTQLTRELPDLLEKQMQALAGRSLDLLSNSERVAYHERKEKILQLRMELEGLREAK
jgi:hypothetical protein